MSNVVIRDAAPEDTDNIRRVTLDASVQYAAVGQALWQVYRQNILETLADVRPAQQIVAEREGEVVGAVLLYPGETAFTRADGSTFTLDSFEVRLLAVTPAARGLGISRMLINECLVRARKAHATAVTLHTIEFMKVAIGMYERMGFVRVPETDFEAAPNAIVRGYRFSLQ